MIAIKDMKMPTSCRDCPLCHDAACYARGYRDDDNGNGLKRRDDCPLVEVLSAQPEKPTVHMEGLPQINEEELAKIMKRMSKQPIMVMPSAQPERDIPIKPIEATDRAWGIPKRQAVCPECDYYLGRVAFLGDYKGKRITYCETCGQAIDWEGWDFDG